MIEPALEQAIININVISSVAITKRTPEQSDTFNRAQNLLRENYRKAFEHCCNADIEHIRRRVLDLAKIDDGVKQINPPLLPSEVTPATITPVLGGFYTGLNTLYGYREQLEPTVNAMTELLKKIKRISTILLALTNEYQNEGIYSLLLPDEIERVVIAHNEMLQTVKMRIEAMINSQNLVSRLITLHIEAPSGQMSRGVA